jgi:hypothetical protein
MPDPAIDPETGKPTEPTPQQMTVTIEELTDLKAKAAKLDVFEKLGPNLGAHQVPQAPAAPAGPTLSDQVKDIDTQVSALDAKIDEAVLEQKPVSKLMRQRDELNAKRIRLQIQHEDINPRLSAGMQTLNDLTSEIVKGQMPYIDIVRDDYEANLNSIPVDSRASLQARQMAYQMAIGKNMSKVLEAEKEKILREAAPTQTTPATTTGRGKDSKGNQIPEPKELLGEGAIMALKEKGQSVDDYYKNMGYDSYADWYEKTGRDYFGSPEPE